MGLNCTKKYTVAVILVIQNMMVIALGDAFEMTK